MFKVLTDLYLHFQKTQTLLPTVRTEKRDGVMVNNPYVAFRRRTEKMQTRKVRSPNYPKIYCSRMLLPHLDFSWKGWNLMLIFIKILMWCCIFSEPEEWWILVRTDAQIQKRHCKSHVRAMIKKYVKSISMILLPTIVPWSEVSMLFSPGNS